LSEKRGERIRLAATTDMMRFDRPDSWRNTERPARVHLWHKSAMAEFRASDPPVTAFESDCSEMPARRRLGRVRRTSRPIFEAKPRETSSKRGREAARRR
jgi:hypothetical protein